MTDIDLTLPAFLDRRDESPLMIGGKPLVYSYTLLNTYRNICPYQAKRRYLDRAFPYVETPEMAFGNKVHLALEHRVGGGKPLPADMHQWEKFAAPLYNAKAKAEQKLGITKTGEPCDFFAKNVWFRGKADVTIINGDTAFIPDWKTGKPREDPFELETNAMLIKAKYPHLKKITGCYIWLGKGGDRIGQQYDLSHVADTFTYVQRIAADLEENWRDQEFEQRKGPLCDWCACNDCPHFTGGKGR